MFQLIRSTYKTLHEYLDHLSLIHQANQNEYESLWQRPHINTRNGWHYSEAQSHGTTPNTRLRNLAPLSLRKTASTVSSPRFRY